jgi:hypothetical protein
VPYALAAEQLPSPQGCDPRASLGGEPLFDAWPD